MRVLFLGDIVGRPGIQLVVNTLPGFRRQQSIDLVIANAENADGGSGLTPSIYRKLLRAGVDCVTLGDH
ncbi:MAG: YmdB family metallophosphoesterase, partial [Planctomycetota bacterium]